MAELTCDMVMKFTVCVAIMPDSARCVILEDEDPAELIMMCEQVMARARGLA